MDTGIDRAGDFADEKTGGKYAEQVDQGQAFAKEKLAEHRDADPDRPESTPEQPIYSGLCEGYLLARSRDVYRAVPVRGLPHAQTKSASCSRGSSEGRRDLATLADSSSDTYKPGCHDPRHPG